MFAIRNRVNISLSGYQLNMCKEKQFYGSYWNRYKLSESCKKHNDVEDVFVFCMSHISMHSFSSLRNACMPLLTQSCLHKYPFLFLLPFSVHPSSFPLHSSLLFLHPLKKTWFDNFNETHALCTAKFKNILYSLQVPAVMKWMPQEIVLNRQYSGVFSDKWYIQYRHVCNTNTTEAYLI
jgi:hypothetical protein